MQHYDEENLKKLQNLLENRLTKEDFIKGFEQVINLVLKVQKDQSEAISRLEETYKMMTEKMRGDNSTSLSDMKTMMAKHFDNYASKHSKMIDVQMGGKFKEIDYKVANIKPIKGDKGDTIFVEPKADEITKAISPTIEQFRKEWEAKVQQVLASRGGVRGLGGASVIVPRPLKGISTDSTPAITGAINGSNKEFVLPKAPVANGLALFLNGVRQRVGSSNDFTLSGKVITFITAPLTGDVLICDIDH